MSVQRYYFFAYFCTLKKINCFLLKLSRAKSYKIWYFIDNDELMLVHFGSE